MTLKEAYDKWSKEDNNKILAMRYRNATHRCFLDKLGDTPLKDVDRNFVFQTFATCKESKEMKVKAASAIVYILRYVFEQKLDPDCQPVNYEYQDILSGQVTVFKSAPKKITKEISDTPEPVYKETGEVKMKSDVVSPKSGEVTTVSNGEKRHHPKAREVAIINPETKEIIHRFPSMNNAEKVCGVRNIDRYCKKHRPLKGVWYAYVDELSDWVADAPVDRENENISNHKSPSVVDRRKKKTINKKENTMTKKEKKENAASNVVAAETSQPKVFSIEAVSTEELIAECRRRGWTGDFYIHIKL